MSSAERLSISFAQYRSNHAEDLRGFHMRKLFLAAVAALCFSSTAAHAQGDFDYQVRLTKGAARTIYLAHELGGKTAIINHPTVILCQHGSGHTQDIEISVSRREIILKKGECIALKARSITVSDSANGTNALPDGVTMILNVKIVQ